MNRNTAGEQEQEEQSAQQPQQLAINREVSWEQGLDVSMGSKGARLVLQEQRMAKVPRGHCAGAQEASSSQTSSRKGWRGRSRTGTGLRSRVPPMGCSRPDQGTS